VRSENSLTAVECNGARRRQERRASSKRKRGLGKVQALPFEVGRLGEVVGRKREARSGSEPPPLSSTAGGGGELWRRISAACQRGFGCGVSGKNEGVGGL
jgi:hypothetical protein